MQTCISLTEASSLIGLNSLSYRQLSSVLALMCLCLVLAIAAMATAALGAPSDDSAAPHFGPARNDTISQDGASGSATDSQDRGATSTNATPPTTDDPDGFTPVYLPQLAILRAQGPIEIDGDLNDAGWQGAAKAANFAEHNPGDQTKPEVNTEVLVAHDDDKLYVAWLCYDDPNEVRATFCERDDIFNDDYVILCIDTFGEGALAYEIASNPYGIPGDLLYSAANGEDIAYDIIFDSAGRITDVGWVVEMAIPFESMRFPGIQEQEWRVDFWRNRPRESRFQCPWAAYDRDNDCWPCQWGTINGIAGVKPRAGLELLPALVVHQSGFLNSDGDFRDDNVAGDLSLGISCDISSELTAKATINPDFSQVESDAAQPDVCGNSCRCAL